MDKWIIGSGLNVLSGHPYLKGGRGWMDGWMDRWIIGPGLNVLSGHPYLEAEEDGWING